MKKKLLAISLLVTSQLANAGGWVSANNINSLRVMNEGILIFGEHHWDNPNDCEKTNAEVLLKSDSNYEEARSLLFAAYFAGKRIGSYSNYCVNADGSEYNSVRGYKYFIVTG